MEGTSVPGSWAHCLVEHSPSSVEQSERCTEPTRDSQCCRPGAGETEAWVLRRGFWAL